jgi:hypothetical protein
MTAAVAYLAITVLAVVLGAVASSVMYAARTYNTSDELDEQDEQDDTDG